MATIERMPLPRYGPQPSFGTTAPITPAITTPTKRAAPMSRGRITKPYSRMRRTTFRLPRSAQHGSVQGGGPPAPEPFCSDSPHNHTSAPPSKPVTKATIGRKTAITGPSRA